MALWDDFIGPLGKLPGDVGRKSGVRELLRHTPFAGGCYRHSAQLGVDMDGMFTVPICFTPFEETDGVPRYWLLTSMGLSNIALPTERGTFMPARFELCGVWKEEDDTSAATLHERWSKGKWSVSDIPSMVTGFAQAAAQLAQRLSRGSSFWFGDTLEDISWFPGFPGGMLSPPTPAMLKSGLVPWSYRSEQLTLKDMPAANWLDRESLTQGGSDAVFMQYVPLRSDELTVAHQQRKAWDFFLHGLLATDSELAAGLGIDAHLVNPARASRLSTFLAR